MTRKLGNPVRCSSQPLKAPTASEKTRARSTPTQTLSPRYHVACAAVSEDAVTATPVDRSNSPPIISMATKIAMIPRVEDW